jgi:hypothetical protein
MLHLLTAALELSALLGAACLVVGMLALLAALIVALASALRSWLAR